MAPADEPSWRSQALQILQCAARAQRWPEHPVDDAVRGRLARAGLDGFVQGRAHPLRRLYEAVWSAQRQAARELAIACDAQGIDLLLFKGAELVARYFDGQPPRPMGDVDVLVKREQLGAVARTLHGQGFRQAFFDAESRSLIDADVADIAATEGRHYELYPFRRLLPVALSLSERRALEGSPPGPLRVIDDECAACIVEIDVHHGVALDVDVAPLWARAIDSVFPGARTLCPADHLWLLTSRLYHEVALHGKRSLRDFAYIAALLRSETIEWPILLQACDDLQLHAALYYYLRFIEGLFERPCIPEDVLCRLDPRAGSRLRDWGWQLAVLFDEVDEAPAWTVNVLRE